MYENAYQKLFYVLLCNEKNEPVLRASHDDCVFLQSTTLIDKQGREIFEGDIVRLKLKGKVFQGVVEEVPDMFKSRRLHPLDQLLKKYGITQDETNQMELETIGNSYLESV